MTMIIAIPPITNAMSLGFSDHTANHLKVLLNVKLVTSVIPIIREMVVKNWNQIALNVGIRTRIAV